MQNHEKTFFIGIKINEKLRTQLDSCNPSMEHFFKENNPEFLQVVEIDSDEYLGKVCENGVTLETLNNIFVNVKTMIKMICPQFIFDDSAIKVMVSNSSTPKSPYYDF